MSMENTDLGADGVRAIFGKMSRGANGVWFLGAGGVSMAALAEATLRTGRRVGGSDRARNPRTDALRRMGAGILTGCDDPIPPGYGAAVYTVAISPDDPQYRSALRQDLPLISRADYLGYLTSPYQTRVGVAGMHGKSTCTAMLAGILLAAGDPTVFAGADLPALGGGPFRAGADRDVVLFEACEYMGSFLRLSPTFAVVLNVGMDHVDYFRDLAHVRATFRQFAGRSDRLLWNADDPESARTFGDLPGTVTFSATDPNADFSAANVRAAAGMVAFDFCEDGRKTAAVSVPVVGRHNAANALAAMAAARLCGVNAETAAEALSGYRGAERRMEYRGTLNGAPVYDDYAHHPDQIRATIAGARDLLPAGGRLLCVYQPHTFSRTAGLFEGFAKAFSGADHLFLADTYAARETDRQGVSSERLAAAVCRNGTDVTATGNVSATATAVLETVRPGDLLLVMGAGDIEDVFSILPLENRSR